MEVDKAVVTDFLNLVVGNLDWDSQGTLGGLDSEMEELNWENLGFDNGGLGCLAGYVGLPHFSS